MGLLQEICLSRLVKPLLWPTLAPGQSGYTVNRSVDDPVMVMYDLNCIIRASGRCGFCVLGDFRKAFPSTWRSDILMQAAERPALRGGYLALLDEMLAKDIVTVTLSNGRTTIVILDGLPEGGLLGPLLYPLLPDSLTRFLISHRCGCATDPWLPSCWVGRRWQGHGTPCQDLVGWLLPRLVSCEDLPSAAFLDAHADVEASALRALDLRDSGRICAVFHADDPVFLASSAGELQRVMNLVSVWMRLHGALLHVGAEKTVVFNLGAYSRPPSIFLETQVGRPPTLLATGDIKKWLGYMWDVYGGVEVTKNKRFAAARAAFSSLYSYVQSGAVPIAFAVHLYISKVDGTLSFFRWLYMLGLDCESLLDALEEQWLCLLCDVPPWSNANILRNELGIQLSAAARGVLDVARRRAHLWLLPDGDFYKDSFLRSLHYGGETWAAKSRVILDDWGVPDIVDAGPQHSYKEYIAHVKTVLAARCAYKASLSWKSRVYPFPYRLLSAHGPAFLHQCLRSNLSWSCLNGGRSWLRLRMGAIELGHKAGKRTHARLQHCIGCQEEVTDAYVHAVFQCPAHVVLRGLLFAVWVQPARFNRE